MFFSENRALHFMRIILLNDSYEMSNLIFREKYEKKKSKCLPLIFKFRALKVITIGLSQEYVMAHSSR